LSQLNIVRAKSKMICNDAAAYLLCIHAISAGSYRGRQMRQFLELGRGVALRGRKVGAEIRKLNLIGRKRLPCRTSKKPILARGDLWGLSDLCYVFVSFADLHE
jgi:hypothetical protein